MALDTVTVDVNDATTTQRRRLCLPELCRYRWASMAGPVEVRQAEPTVLSRRRVVHVDGDSVECHLGIPAS